MRQREHVIGRKINFTFIYLARNNILKVTSVLMSIEDQNGQMG